MNVTGWAYVDQRGDFWVADTNISAILDKACESAELAVVLAHFVPIPGVAGGRAGGACCTPTGWCAFGHDLNPQRMFVFSSSGIASKVEGAYLFDGVSPLQLDVLSGHHMHFSIATSQRGTTVDLSDLATQLETLIKQVPKPSSH